jgi:uncharacterized protein YggE
MNGSRQFLVGAAVATALESTFALARSGGGHDVLVSPAQAATTAPGPAATPLTPYLKFTGTGTVRVKPDTASISFTTSGEDSSKSTAVNAAGAGMRRVIAAMQQHGVARGDLQTNMDVYRDTTRGVYQASEYLQVTVRQVSDAGKLLAAGLNAGADSSSGPSFSLTDQNAGYTSALRAAVANARAHADAASALIGAHVTGVISVDDSATAQGGPIYAQSFGAAADSVQPVPVAHGMQEVSVSVTVVFSYATG